jgi:hypothetical protein
MAYPDVKVVASLVYRCLRIKTDVMNVPVLYHHAINIYAPSDFFLLLKLCAGSSCLHSRIAIQAGEKVTNFTARALLSKPNYLTVQVSVPLR